MEIKKEKVIKEINDENMNNSNLKNKHQNTKSNKCHQVHIAEEGTKMKGKLMINHSRFE